MNKSSNKFFSNKLINQNEHSNIHDKKLSKDEYNFYFNNHLQNQIKNTGKKLKIFLNQISDESQKSEEKELTNYNKNVAPKLIKSQTPVQNSDILNVEKNIKVKLRRMYSQKINELKHVKTGNKTHNMILGLDESNLNENSMDLKNPECLNTNYIKKTKYKDINNTISKLFDERKQYSKKKFKQTKHYSESLKTSQKRFDKIKKFNSLDKNCNILSKNEVVEDSGNVINKIFFPNLITKSKKLNTEEKKIVSSNKLFLLDNNNSGQKIQINMISNLKNPKIIKINSKEKNFKLKKNSEKIKEEIKESNQGYLSEEFLISEKGSNLDKKKKNKNSLKNDKNSLQILQRLNKGKSQKKKSTLPTDNYNKEQKDFILKNIDDGINFISLNKKQTKYNSFIEKMKSKLNVKNQLSRRSKLLEKISLFNENEKRKSQGLINHKKNDNNLNLKKFNSDYNMINNQFHSSYEKEFFNKNYNATFKWNNPYHLNKSISICNNLKNINYKLNTNNISPLSNKSNFHLDYEDQFDDYFYQKNQNNKLNKSSICYAQKSSFLKMIKNYSIEIFNGKFDDSTKKYSNLLNNRNLKRKIRNINKKDKVSHVNDDLKIKNNSPHLSSSNIKSSGNIKYIDFLKISNLDNLRKFENPNLIQNIKTLNKLDNILSFLSIPYSSDENASYLETDKNKSDNVIIEDLD